MACSIEQIPARGGTLGPELDVLMVKFQLLIRITLVGILLQARQQCRKLQTPKSQTQKIPKGSMSLRLRAKRLWAATGQSLWWPSRVAQAAQSGKVVQHNSESLASRACFAERRIEW